MAVGPGEYQTRMEHVGAVDYRVNSENIPCLTSEKQLDIGEVIKLLENYTQHVHASYPPVKPKGGEAFLFFPDRLEEQDNWKCDQYRWLNYGLKEIPKRDPLVKKLFFVGKVPEGRTNKFQRHVYTLIGDHRSPKPVLVHYLGDSTAMIDHPHGNQKKSNVPYFATAPSVRRSLSSKAKAPRGTPSRVLQEATLEAPDNCDNPCLTPRNKIQVRNIRRNIARAREKQRPSAEDMVTLYSLGSELAGFFHYVRTYPDFAVIVGLNDLSIEVENLLKLNAGPLVFSFHETFKTGKYYVTTFNFVHAAFSDRPVIPSHFLITECTDEFLLYEKLLRTVSGCIPMLDQLETAVVTSQEHNFAAPLNLVFPNFMQVYDWELVLMTARSWLRKSNQAVKAITDRCEDLRVLLNSPTYDEFLRNLDKFKLQWDSAFCSYFEEYLLEIIRKRLGRWILEKYKLYHPQMGVIGARNLDLQIVVRHLQELKEVTLDILLPSLYHLQVFLSANVLKAFCGLGKYELCSELGFLKRETDELTLPSKMYEPNEIVNILKVRGISLVCESAQEEGEVGSVLQAQQIVEMDNIVHCHQLQAFLVKSPSGSLQAVKLFPRESCSCSFSQRCSHIMAVMISVGMPLFPETIKPVKPRSRKGVLINKFMSSIPAVSAYIEYQLPPHSLENVSVPQQHSSQDIMQPSSHSSQLQQVTASLHPSPVAIQPVASHHLQQAAVMPMIVSNGGLGSATANVQICVGSPTSSHFIDISVG